MAFVREDMNPRRIVALVAVAVFALAVVGVAVLNTGGSDKPKAKTLPILHRAPAAADAGDPARAGRPAIASAPAFATDYVVKGTLPDLGATAPAYGFSAQVTNDE